MFDVDVIIPCYGESKLINRGLSSLASSWKSEYIHVTLVNDCSPNTECGYQDLIDRYKDDLDIRVIKTPENVGQGLARQYGVDNTDRPWFLFMDEDDMYTPLAISIIVGTCETYGAVKDANGNILLNQDGSIKYEQNRKKVGVVSAPLFEFDDNHTHVIESHNTVWINAKLYSRELIEKHKIRFNKAQSRHAEDYYWSSCFFHALDNDPDYIGIMMDNEGLYYLWYPNEKSQSRSDPHYGFMLSGYTMDGSVNILKFIKNNKTIKWTEQVKSQYRHKLLNMTVYSYYTFLSFIRHVATTDYIPKLEEDWYLLRDACNSLREMLSKSFDQYSYMEWIQELFGVKNYSDVQYSEPWIEFDEYVRNGMDEFSWDFETLLKCKKTYKFNKEGFMINGTKGKTQRCNNRSIRK